MDHREEDGGIFLLVSCVFASRPSRILLRTLLCLQPSSFRHSPWDAPSRCHRVDANWWSNMPYRCSSPLEKDSTPSRPTSPWSLPPHWKHHWQQDDNEGRGVLSTILVPVAGQKRDSAVRMSTMMLIDLCALPLCGSKCPDGRSWETLRVIRCKTDTCEEMHLAEFDGACGVNTDSLNGLVCAGGLCEEPSPSCYGSACSQHVSTYGSVCCIHY